MNRSNPFLSTSHFLSPPTLSFTKMLGKQFLPVIHVFDLEQMLRNLEIAVTNGADGVFLINHGSMSSDELIGLHAKAVESHPDLWIGVNCLDLSGEEVFHRVPDSVDGIWVDDGGICDEGASDGEMIARSRKRSSFKGVYFGGVAFKGQEYVRDVKKVSRVARELMDVVTTSGDGTGQAASVTKIASMKESIGDKPLALASGVTVDNVGNYLPYVDFFLVATGISTSFYELDPVKVMCLAKAIHEY